MAVRGWALMHFGEEPATRFKRLQGGGLEPRWRGWPRSARIVRLHKVSRIYPRAPKYLKFHAFVELIADSKRQLERAFTILERFTHVEGYSE
jgi:hypothetical protein